MANDSKKECSYVGCIPFCYLLLGGVICKMGSFLPNWDLGYLAVISNFAVHISILGAFWNFLLKLLV